jgi:tRNA threonylcarbamoyladenosine biosynthesis protein TsaE
MKKSFICKNIEDTKKIAEGFGQNIKDCGCFVCLYGEIGAGKTAFARFVAKGLNVKEKVTSPSFVILNEYKSGDLPIYHFDLYRLEKEGVKTIIDELKEYSEGKILTFVEWAEFSQDEIPFDRININVTYNDDDSRNYEFESFSDKGDKIIEGIL